MKVIQARIAERMGISRPAVSEMVKKLTADGYITKEGNQLALTADGKRVADRTVRRHRLAERFLTDVLGLSWSEAHHEAGKWEHVISDSVEASMTRLLEEPTTCPHGNPIPGSGYIAPETQALSETECGASVTISRIPEELEFIPGMLEFLESRDITPGAVATIIDTRPNGSTSIEIGGKTVKLDLTAASRILVSAD